MSVTSVKTANPPYTATDTARRAGKWHRRESGCYETCAIFLPGSGVIFDLRQVHIDKKQTEHISLYALM